MTYLRRGINAFFAEYALEEFSRPGFEAVLCDPFEILLVAEKNRLVQGYIRLTLNSDCGLEGTGVAEIKRFMSGRGIIIGVSARLCCALVCRR